MFSEHSSVTIISNIPNPKQKPTQGIKALSLKAAAGLFTQSEIKLKNTLGSHLKMSKISKLDIFPGNSQDCVFQF